MLANILGAAASIPQNDSGNQSSVTQSGVTQNASAPTITITNPTGQLAATGQTPDQVVASLAATSAGLTSDNAQSRANTLNSNPDVTGIVSDQQALQSATQNAAQAVAETYEQYQAQKQAQQAAQARYDEDQTIVARAQAVLRSQDSTDEQRAAARTDISLATQDAMTLQGSASSIATNLAGNSPAPDTLLLAEDAVNAGGNLAGCLTCYQVAAGADDEREQPETPAEILKLDEWKDANAALRRLNPNDPLLNNAASPNYIPTWDDLRELQDEVGRLSNGTGGPRTTGVDYPGVTPQQQQQFNDIMDKLESLDGNASTLVCRGGTCQADSFTGGRGVTRNVDGTLSGVSTQSSPGSSLLELAQPLKNGQVGVTTIERIQNAGGSVVFDGTPQNPNHATVNGLTAEQLQELFTPTVPNPVPKSQRGQ